MNKKELVFMLGWYLNSAREWVMKTPQNVTRLYNKVRWRKLRKTFINRVNYTPTVNSPVKIYKEDDLSATPTPAWHNPSMGYNEYQMIRQTLQATVNEIQEIRKNCKEC
jgi:hypothetical protein